MEVDIENIQFTKHCVKLTGSLVKWIFISLQEKKASICYFRCIFSFIVAVIRVATQRLGALYNAPKEVIKTDEVLPTLRFRTEMKALFSRHRHLPLALQFLPFASLQK